jgi:hypothetical protein
MKEELIPLIKCDILFSGAPNYGCTGPEAGSLAKLEAMVDRESELQLLAGPEHWWCEKRQL